MKKPGRTYAQIFMVVAILATIFVAAEAILQSQGKSICQTEGCRLVSQHTRFGDLSILLIGIATFSLLSALSYASLFAGRSQVDRHITTIMIVSLAAEGYLLGYQVFRLQSMCLFCMITFAFFATLSVLWMLYGGKEVMAGFLSCASIFALFYLVSPPAGASVLPPDGRVLFYSKDCKYCSEVMSEMDARKIEAVRLPVGEYAGLLATLGIEHVPVLYVNTKTDKRLLTGKEAILRYFAEAQRVAVPPAPSRRDAAASVRSPESPRPDRASHSLDAPGTLQLQPEDAGMCKETEKCD